MCIRDRHTGMRGVVSGKDSSVSSIFQGMKVKLAGKTGTAQENKKRPNHALFISYGPYEKPEITTTVVIPFGYTLSLIHIYGRDQALSGR